MKNVTPNIIMITPSYIPDYSGYSKQAHQVNKLLIENGVNIKVIPKRSDSSYTKVDGIEIIHLSRKVMKFFNNYKFFKEIVWIISIMTYLLLNKRKYHIVHILGSGPSTLVFSVFCGLLNKPVIVKMVIADPKSDQSRKYKIRNYILKHFTYTVAISKEIKDYLLENGFKKNKILTIPNGVNTEKFSPVKINRKIKLRRKYNFDEHTFIATHVGLNEKRKGIDVLVKAWNKFLIKNPYAKLLLIGPSKDEKFHKWLVNYLDKNNLQDNIILVGHVNNINEYLNITDVFLFPSEREGLPNALMEAMASGLPCVGRNIGGVNDLIEHNVNGLICFTEEDDLILELYRAIIWLYKNKNLAVKMGGNARKKMIDMYSISNIAYQYKEVYTKLIK